MSRGSDVGDMDEPPSLLGKAVAAMLGRSQSLGLPTMKPAFLKLSFLISSGKEPGPHPAAAGGTGCSSKLR